MSAKTMLLEELAHASEPVVQEMLAYLRKLMPPEKPALPQPKDHFETYWKQFYGSMEDAEWDEPSEPPIEKREIW